MDIRRSLLMANSITEEGGGGINYFTIEAIENGLTVSLDLNDIEYCIDKNYDNWITLKKGNNTQSINAGQRLSFRGDYTKMSIGGTNSEGYQQGMGTFNISKKCNLTGNIMSLLYGDSEDLESELIIPCNNAFAIMFLNQVNIINVDENLLPATTLTSYAYYNMFAGCNNLENAPKLPCTNLNNLESVYCGMFYDCTKLTVAPELPATSLGPTCYAGMFGATGLLETPTLPATTLTTFCYQAMFTNCTSLTKVNELPATTLANNCYDSMFEACTSLTTVPDKLPATTLVTKCYCYMFYGCTSLKTAPILPANSLKTSCYEYMFYNCKSLNYIKCLSTTRLGTSYSKYWVSGVASSGTFVRHSSRTQSNSTSAIPSGWAQQTATS